MKFDFIIISDTLNVATDIQQLFHEMKKCTKPETRIIISHFNYFWLPILGLAEKLGLKNRQERNNWITNEDLYNFLTLEKYQIITHKTNLLVPFHIPYVSDLINRYFVHMPLINKFCFLNFIVARPLYETKKNKSVSIVVPARNEEKNIENTIKRLPKFGRHQEIIFIEGHSKDNTWFEIKRVQNKYKDVDIKAVKQTGLGKADAVRKGFKIAKGEILIILDADLTVSPKELPKFYNAITTGTGEYINGCRLVYPMEKGAMQFLNTVANHIFSIVFSWILGQKIKDTLCGTKVIARKDYDKIAKNRSYFGNFDPFGDFDLIFGAAKLNLKFIEVPVHYKSREYGQTNISRFRHGLLLLKMTLFSLSKIKFA